MRKNPEEKNHNNNTVLNQMLKLQRVQLCPSLIQSVDVAAELYSPRYLTVRVETRTSRASWRENKQHLETCRFHFLR